MTDRIVGPPRGKRRRRFFVAALASLVALGAFLVANAVAVHDEAFQLDGNVVDDAGSPQPVDWANFFDGNGDELPLPTGFDASSFDRDFVTNANGIFNTSDTTFTTGSKDTLAIDPGWQYTASNNVNSILDRHDRTILETIAVGAEILASGADVITLGRERSTRPVPT